MFIQCLDKNLFYYDKQIHCSDVLPSDISCTWNYNSYFGKTNIEIINIYVNGQSSKNFCSSKLLERYTFLLNKFKSFTKLFNERKNFDYNNIRLDEMIPIKFLLDYCMIKEEIAFSVLENHQKPSHYEILSKIIKIIETIKFQQINLDDCLKEKYKPYIHYNPWSVITGRMGLYSGWFPITNLKKEKRKYIKPQNDFFFEVDMNSAEIRIILALMGFTYPKEVDIHDFHNKEKWNNSLSREEIKRDFYSWLYNPLKKCDFYDSVYKSDSIEQLKEVYYRDGFIETVFGRKIPCEEKKWLSYLAQSTCSDTFFENLYKVWLKLINMQSFIGFTLHDSAVLDVSTWEKEYIVSETVDAFSKTRFGEFKVNQKEGFDYGSMKTPQMNSQQLFCETNGKGRV